MDIKQHHHEINTIANSNKAYPNYKYKGQGIVTCGGGQTYFTCVWVLVNMLRYLGCQLPIEIWYLGDHEMNSTMLQIISEIPNVTCINAYQVSKLIPVKKLDGWELKIYAIKNSSFEEVLFIDADNVPTKNPEYLFQSPQYLEYHSIFWTDNDVYPTALTGSWEACDVKPIENKIEFESGQILINKSKCWKALTLASYFNENSDFFYHYLFGDKDTFRMAWLKTDTPYKSPRLPICLKGNLVIYQHDFDNNIIFQHRSGSKWKLNNSTPSVASFQHEDQCRTFIMMLRQKWNGIVRSLPNDFNDKEKFTYNEICKNRKYIYHNIQQRNIIDLLPSFNLGLGKTNMEDCWNLFIDKDDIPVITLGKSDRVTCFLRQHNDIWKGLYLFSFRNEITLSLY